MLHANEPSLASASRPVGGLKRIVSGGLLVVAVGLATITVWRERAQLAAAFSAIGGGSISAAFAMAIVATALNLPVWNQVLRGMSVELNFVEAARVFFASQLGKYLPGSVWPIVLQMEEARRRGFRRSTVAAANLLTIIVGCTVGLGLACIFIPLTNVKLLSAYWWVLAVLPVLALCLHPRTTPWLINQTLRLLRRPALPAGLDAAATRSAALWSTVAWLALGLHVAVMALAVQGGGISTTSLCVGGTCLAVVAGILAVPIPAGAVVRDAVLAAVLTLRLSTSQALAIALASRAMLIVADVILAGLALAAAAWLRRQARRRAT